MCRNFELPKIGFCFTHREREAYNEMLGKLKERCAQLAKESHRYTTAFVPSELKDAYTKTWRAVNHMQQAVKNMHDAGLLTLEDWQAITDTGEDDSPLFND